MPAPATGRPAPSAPILLLTPRYSYRIGAYLRAAETLDLPLLVASDGEHSLVGALKDGLHVDLSDPAAARERILATVRERPVRGVVATEDSVVELAAALARDLGLAGNPVSAGRFARRKDLARARQHAAGLAVPAHQVMDFAAIAAGAVPEVPFPLVLKPLSLSASRGVIRADDIAQLRTAAARIAAIVAGESDRDTRHTVLLERYLPGTEIALEGLLYDGRLHLLCAFDKPDPLTGPFFEETYYVTPARLAPARLAQAAGLVQATCDAYGLHHGPVHAELRVDGGEMHLLEVAARTIGGQCALLVEFATGHSLEALVLANALGREPPATVQRGAAGVLMIPIPRPGVLRRVEGVLAAERIPGIERVELWLREGHALVPLPEGASYLGFVFARGETPQAVEGALRRAHAELHIVVAPRWDIVAA